MKHTVCHCSTSQLLISLKHWKISLVLCGIITQNWIHRFEQTTMNDFRCWKLCLWFRLDCLVKIWTMSSPITAQTTRSISEGSCMTTFNPLFPKNYFMCWILSTLLHPSTASVSDCSLISLSVILYLYIHSHYCTHMMRWQTFTQMVVCEVL